VSSVVEGEVLVDGNKIGRTPQELELPAGPHTIIVRTAAGVEKKVVWKLKAGEVKTFAVPAPAAVPPPVLKGKLNVNAPPFCSLSVDGKRLPGPPVMVWNVDLPAGSHLIECTLEDPSLPKPRVKSKKVTIAGGEVSNVEFNMGVE
jgi:hypothetical protein